MNLKITARLRTPVVRGIGYMTFDAIVASVIIGGYDPDVNAASLIPIESSNGLFMASAMMMQPFAASRVAFTGSIYPDRDLSLATIKLNKTGTDIHTNPHSTEFTNVMNSYVALSAHKAEWIVAANRHDIEPLLDSIQFIGKRRTAGYGEVESWRITETSESPLMDDNGHPRRPIPASMFNGDRSLPVQDVAWTPAYWDPMNRAPCYAPILEA